MTNTERALNCIKKRMLFDLRKNQMVFVNKLIYWEDDLMIRGYDDYYKAEDYGITWKEGN